LKAQAISTSKPASAASRAATAIVAEAQARGATVSPAGGRDSVNIHCACGTLDEGPVELHRGQARIARLPGAAPVLRDGHIAPPEAPGLGLNPDEAAPAACAL
jgi:L-alanine-DL-glutamate epimerase-like enolase superfamily enzyme